ncbi:MAG TPA: hypothetical protein VEF04_03905, partial [Blastocatellia bacterium]|nr:hypothetical protein [Blastocatellia bacterium]
MNKRLIQVSFSPAQMIHGVNHGPVSLEQFSWCLDFAGSILNQLLVHPPALECFQVCHLAVNDNCPVEVHSGLPFLFRYISMPHMRRSGFFEQGGETNSAYQASGGRSLKAYFKDLQLLNHKNPRYRAYGIRVSKALRGKRLRRIETEATRAQTVKKIFGVDCISDILLKHVTLPTATIPTLQKLLKKGMELLKAAPKAKAVARHVHDCLSAQIKRWHKKGKAARLCLDDLKMTWTTQRDKGIRRLFKEIPALGSPSHLLKNLTIAHFQDDLVRDQSVVTKIEAALKLLVERISILEAANVKALPASLAKSPTASTNLLISMAKQSAREP